MFFRLAGLANEQGARLDIARGTLRQRRGLLRGIAAFLAVS
jgi:hypothetical protein